MSQPSATTQLVEFWTNRIQIDLAPFSDPGGEVQLVKQGRTITATWSQRMRDREAKFAISHDGVKVTSGHREFAYRAFFASAEMADLPSLARMILKVRPAQLYVETKARVEGADDAKMPVATPRELVQRLNAEAVKALHSPDVTQKLPTLGQLPVGSTPEQFEKQFRADIAKFEKVVRDARIPPQD